MPGHRQPDKVDEIKEIQEKLLEATRQLVQRLERASPTEIAIFDAIREKLKNLICWFREHNLQENELLVEALFRDTGGEG